MLRGNELQEFLCQILQEVKKTFKNEQRSMDAAVKKHVNELLKVRHYRTRSTEEVEEEEEEHQMVFFLLRVART